VTLAEQLVLLALDPMRGRPAPGVVSARLRRGAAAAILAELVMHHRLVARGDRVAMADALPDYHQLLGEAGALIRRGGVPLPLAEALQRVERGIPKLVERVLDSLVARDLLHHYRQVFFLHRYPLRSRQALDEVFAVLHRVMENKAPSASDLALAAMADCCGVASARLPSEKQFLLRRGLHNIDPALEGRAELETVIAIAKIAEDVG